MPPHRWRNVASGFDACQEVSKVGLKICFVIRRRHAVDARRAILARQTIGLEHPFKVDKMMQRGQHPLSFIPRQIGYPLLFRGQVCRTQSSLPCFSSMGLCARRLPFLERVPVSPVPRLPRYYKAATTSRGACPLAYDFALGFRTCLVLRARSRAPNRHQADDWAWSIVQPVAPGRRFYTDTHGTSQVPWRPIPYLCPALRPRPNRLFLAIAALPMLPPLPTR
jgi:hypothetical protein